MSYGNMSSAGGGDGNITIQAMKEVAKDTRLELYAEKISAKSAFKELLAELVNPFVKRIETQRKTLKSHLQRISKLLKQGDRAERLEILKQMSQQADDFQRRNPELKAKVLLLLREQIKPGDTKDDILQKMKNFYPDVSLADEALEFLLETTEGELRNQILEAKKELNETHGREIIAGRNIGDLARQTEGLGTPTTLRDLYRDITGTPRSATTLFDELATRYHFKELKKVFKFLFHSLGTDMKSKGPSIARGELHRLMQETRTLQAILGVYRFFAGRMRLVHRLFAKEGLQLPQRLNFELFSKQFMEMCQERYPSADKVLKMAAKLGIEKWIIAKIIVFSQMRDAVREVSMNQIFRSLQHRDDLYNAIIELLEDLEAEWEEYQEKEKEEEEEREESEEDEEDQENENNQKEQQE